MPNAARRWSAWRASRPCSTTCSAASGPPSGCRPSSRSAGPPTRLRRPPGCSAHRLPERDGRHALRVEPGTRLFALAGGRAASVGSRHHQAVSDPGPRLRVPARTDDGVIEAVERDAAPFCVGVQWHPETDGGPLAEALFAAFVAAARGR